VRLPGSWVLLGVALSFVIAIAAVGALTQTSWGRSQILAFTVRAIGGRLSGDFSIGRIDGNMLTGARLYDVALRGYDGVPLAEIDSAYIQYRVVSFLGGDIVINRLAAWNAAINLVKMPGDTTWNYEEILTDPTPDPNAAPVGILIDRLILNDSPIAIRGPVAADLRLSPEAQQEEIAAMIADTARWYIAEVPGGHLREMFLDVDSAAAVEVFIGASSRGGIYLQAEDARADFRGSREPPLQIRGARGQLQLLDGLARVDLPSFALPDTEGSMIGTVDLTGDRPMYDLAIETPRYALSDMRWLFPWFPEDPEAARGSGNFTIQDEPDEMIFLARDFVLEMPRSRVTGEFALAVGLNSFEFIDVALDADPLDADDLGRLLPEGMPVSGLEIGGVEIE